MNHKAVWYPEPEMIQNMRLTKWMNKLGYEDYDSFYQKSIEDIEWLWEEAISDMKIEWFHPYSNVLDLEQGIQWPAWFVDGKLNVCHNAVDKWADGSNRTAMIWESEEGERQFMTYEQLLQDVCQCAHGLLKLGMRKGDRVVIYMPMIPETVIAMLAVARIGAVYTPVFSGFAADAVRKRIEASEAKLVVTADGFYRRGKKVLLKETLDQALEQPTSVEHVLVASRLQDSCPMEEGRDVAWDTLLSNKKDLSCAVMASDDPFMLIYTSGTTSKPKGIVHTHSGFPIKAAFDAGYGMDVQEEDRMLWLTDMGWMMGPFLVFGTLLNGATMVFYDGSPDYPTPGRLWKMVEEHQITHLGISPTLIRAMMGQGEEWFDSCDLSSLKVIGSTGEPWNEEPWLWLFHKVGKGKIPIFNYSGGTEISGGIFGNVLLKPIAPVGFNAPLPGMEADVYAQDGTSVKEKENEVGELVLKKPWVGMAHGFWQEPERYEQTYWSRWKDTWVHGDWVKVDEEGFWYITGRSDDTLNIAGKRMGPAEMESVLVEHSMVKEAGVIGVPDEIKGEAAVCFVVLNSDGQEKARKNHQYVEECQKELLVLVQERLGKALKPKRIYFVQDLPKTRNAKIMRRIIRTAYLNKDLGDLSALENPSTLKEIQALSDS